MAYVKFFPLVASFSSLLWFASALKSSFFFMANNSAIWKNNDDSFPEAVHFSDGFVARFILLKEEQGNCSLDSRFGFGFGFYCSLSAAESCHLSIVFVQILSNNTIVDPQVVWTASRESPISKNAILEFSHDGDLMLLAGANGAKVWSSNTSGKSVSGMSINEQGNMVLSNQTNGTVWQSFDHPTDTLLPGQKLVKGQQLTSSFSSVNVSHGLFHIRIGHGSLLAFATVDRPTRYLSFAPKWWLKSSCLKYVKFTKGMVTFFYREGNDTLAYEFKISHMGITQFLRVDIDGGLRVYGWKRGSGWKAIFLFLDFLDECQFPLKCGRYGVCLTGQCTCPVAVDGVDYFTAINSSFPDRGCQQITASLSQGRSNPKQLVSFGHLSYFSYFDRRQAVTGLEDEESCKQACQIKTSCEAVFFMYDNNNSQGYCYLPSELLSIIGNSMPNRYYSSAYIKVHTLSSSQASSKFRKQTALAIFAFVLVVLILAIVRLLLLRKKKKYGKTDQDFLKQLSKIPQKFSFCELCIATAKFSEKLGGGGFGTVFKGVLRDGTVVAVKRLENIGQGIKEFIAEVDTVGKIHHVNLVRLIGYCVEKRHRMLVYEYMSKGSLDKWIFSENKNLSLDWNTRKKILVDVAKGLSYLHEDCRQRIAHLDVKPHNILLDDNFNAKLSDFGMSKLINRDESQVITHLRGTLGYLAPEWQYSKITVKADIYSFGIVLLEVVSGRRNLDYSQSDSEVCLLSLLQKKALENQLMDIIDCQSEDMQCHSEEVIEIIKLGMSCLNFDYTRRPPMSLVAKVLEGVMELESDISYSIPSVLSSAPSSTICGSFS